MTRADFTTEEEYLAYRRKYARHNQKYYGKTQERDIYYMRWSPSEDKRILERDVSDTELAYELGRSTGSIQKRRWALKKQELANKALTEGAI